MKTPQFAYRLFKTAFFTVVVSLSAFAQPTSSCEALAKLTLPQPKIVSAQIVAAGEFTPLRTSSARCLQIVKE